MWIDEGYFEQLFWMKSGFNIKFGEKPIFAQNSNFQYVCFQTNFEGKYWKKKKFKKEKIFKN